MIVKQDLIEKTREYYDSHDANSFYYDIWGGEDIHIGMYDDDSESISDASRRTVSAMEKLIPELSNQSKVLDIGSGFGGSARILAKNHGCKIECLNLSDVQNEINRKLTKKEGLAGLISIKSGNFENLPYESEVFDVVWCQDAILHSENRKQVLDEVYRVLKQKGTFVFSDPMQNEESSTDSLKEVLARIHLDSLSTISFYRKAAESVGFKDYLFKDSSKNLPLHYQKVLDKISQEESNIKDKCSAKYMTSMKKGLKYWIEGGKSGDLRWGIFRFTKQ